MMRPNTPPESPTDVTLSASPTPVDAVSASPQPQLVVLLQADAPMLPSTRHLLSDVDRVAVGRGPARGVDRTTEGGASTLSLRFPDALVSTRHAVLVRHGGGGGWHVEDAGSKNGTWVNGRRVDRALLVDGDLVEFGQTFCLYREAAPVDGRTSRDTADATALAAAPAWATFHDPLAAQYRRLYRVARTTVPVLVLGETGTGKEVVARTLHQLSGRAPEMLAVNCAAIPASLIEAELFGHKKGAFTGSGTERAGWIRSADRSTLFLDEIGELPTALQATFLRALETGEVVPVGADRPVKVDFRLVSATNRDLDAEVDRGGFRADLRARLGAMVITLPPLRDRREDLGLLLPALLARVAAGVPLRLRREAARALLLHRWPGNLRELVQVLTQAVAQIEPGGFIETEHLPDGLLRAPSSTPSGPLPGPNTAGEAPPEPGPVADEATLRALLTEHRGNVAAVGRALGLHRELVYRALRKFELDPAAFREPGLPASPTA
jgi:DNA-binding NtrC family response regulator